MNKQLEDIKVIREMMECSSKFLSLSGLSGIVAGITAIIGAFIADFYILPLNNDFTPTHEEMFHKMLLLIVDAMVILLISISFGIYFSRRKAIKNNQKISGSLIRKTLYNLSIPLLTGGIFAFIFLLQGNIPMVIAMTLTFYGLALVNVSKYTYDEIHYLGLLEIILGVAAAIFTQHGIWFWIFGFGFFHISYGITMYIKYDLKKDEKHHIEIK
ncbi:hypothetical protein [Parabacteroides sp. AM08-6]|uniref:hypothetical protein n=1 Tax=Parabacteroides sp. AM08-6 TaxID=2292053 RepID=UPI001F1C5B4B|nr:hypothetical protein [Parabacteroides sp. AM08-6]